MSPRTFLELTHNPFTPPRSGFFKGAERAHHLDQIRHLSQWSRRVLLVTGPFGIGKSTLFRELAEHLPEAIRIAGTAVTDEVSVVHGVAQALGVDVGDDMDTDDALEVLAEHVAELEAAEKTTVILVDDSQLLEFAAMTALIKLVSHSAARLVLFAEATAIANVTRAASQEQVEWFELRLTGFSAADVRNYLEWRFAQAQYRGRLPFTEEQVKGIAQRSGGNPNVIDFMANELLQDLETGDFRQKRILFPKRHLVLAVVLVAFVGLAYTLYQQPPETERVAQAESTGTETQMPDERPYEPTAADASDQAGPADQPAQIGPAGDTQGGIGDEPPDSLESALEDSEIVMAPAEEAVEPTPTDAEVAQMQAEPEAIAEQADADTTFTEPAASSSEPAASESAERDAPDARTIPPVEVSEPVVAARPERRPEPTPSPAEVDNPSINTEAWLLRQNPDHFTLQLMTLSRQQGGIGLIGRQPDGDEFAMFRMQRDGRTLYVVTYGVFSSRSGAQAAADGLSGELAGIKPWIRTFSGIQDTIRAQE